MLIKSIEIQNFLSYYKQPRIDFGDGSTIIIGQNNTGKSKLFDAFNWVFYDRAFKTKDEEWFETKDWCEDLVNNFAKAQCKISSSVTASVVVIFEDDNSNRFILTREYKIKKKGANQWDAPRASTLQLNRKDSRTNNSTDIFDLAAEAEIKSLFPPNLSKYFLFQGENISQIMSLNNKSAFTKALHDLSRIEIFEKSKNYSDRVYKKLKKEFEEKTDSNEQIQLKKIELSGELDKLKDDLQGVKDDFDNAVRERDSAREVLNKREEELKKFQECAKILGEIKFLEEQRDSKIEIRKNLIGNQKKEIFDTWMYAGTEKILKNFISLYEKNKVEQKIPEPIRQEFVREMLAKQLCLVCNSEAKKGSPQYNHIQTLLNEKSLDKETEIINKLSFVADNYYEKTGGIKSEIQEFYRRIDGIDEQIKSFDKKLKLKDAELRDVIPSDVSEDEVKKKSFAQLQKDRDNAKSDLEKYEIKITGAQAKIDYIEKNLGERQKDYDSLVDSSTNKKEKERLQLSERISNTLSEFYENFLNKLISDIEIEANQYFNKMTERNTAISGKVKVDYQLKEIYTIDESGSRLVNINQANKVSLQISFVAAVLSVSNKFWNTYFPFIADAPISALGGNNKVTAVETMIKIFKQSIIILKDDAVTSEIESVRNDLIRNLIMSNKEIQNAYELKMEGTTIEEQQTKIIKIK